MQEPCQVSGQPDVASAGTGAQYDRISVCVEPLAEGLRRLTGGTGEVPLGVLVEISQALQETPEQRTVVGPLVAYLVTLGWSLEQIVFGRNEWRVPKNPSECTNRERAGSYSGFSVDIAVFDDPLHREDYRHLLFMVECKQPTEEAGVSQLESYFVAEPHVRLGVWANYAERGARAKFVYRDKSSNAIRKNKLIGDLPRPGKAIDPESQRRYFKDLETPSDQVLKRTISDLLDKVVITDANVTRREDQLDQLCNLLLLKLESDKEARSNEADPVFFRNYESASKTATKLRKRYTEFVNLYPGVFFTDQDKVLRFSDSTLEACVEYLSGLRLIELGVTTFSMAFQVLRSEALKQGEGQYFTPQPVIEAGVRLMGIKYSDLILDPACGTGGFLVEALLELKRTRPGISDGDLSKWAQTHLFGIDKDAIGVKLTKAVMQIAGDGSAHCMRGDSIRTHTWHEDFPHLLGSTFEDGRFSAIITNPPFGKKLKVSATDSRLAGFDLAKKGGNRYRNLEIGLLFLERSFQLLREGGRLGIVLPETYFFSPSYRFVLDWIKPRFQTLAVANIPMEAFEGFCRAKTNFYVFEKRLNASATGQVTLLNPRTCGIYKGGLAGYKTDPSTGKRTDEIDNELLEHVKSYLRGQNPEGLSKLSASEIFERRVLVPTYYDPRYQKGIDDLLGANDLEGVTVGELLQRRTLSVRIGHGSPPNDQRTGDIPYVKVSDLRALRVNVNPTNLVSQEVASRFWKGETSQLEAWDLITPSRASSNIGEFSILLPGEERLILTKEVLIFRSKDHEFYDPFYLLWAFSLKAVREQWRRIALMQTNREDCGKRYGEIVLPRPPNRNWAQGRSAAFRAYFKGIAKAKTAFVDQILTDDYRYTAQRGAGGGG